MTNKDNRLLIAGGIGAMALAIVGTVFFVTTDIGKEPIINTKVEEVAVAKATVDKLKETPVKTAKLTGEPVFTNYRELITPIGYGDKEFPLEQGATFKEKLLSMVEAGELDMLTREVESKLESFRFSEGVNLEIAGLYYDATLTQSLIGKTEAEMRKMLPNAYKTPEMLALMTLYLPEYARRDMIHDNMSLTPLTDGPFNFYGTRYIDNREDADEDEVYQEYGVAISMFNVIDGLHQIHVVSVTRQEEPEVVMNAYIAELANGQLQLYGYYIEDDVTHYYQTIEFFKELDAEYIVPNAEYQQKLIEQELKDGKLPEEVVDVFLNPTK